MDEDHDGAVKADHILKVLELLSESQVGFSKKMLEDVVSTLSKEEQLETQTLIQRALKASKDMKLKHENALKSAVDSIASKLDRSTTPPEEAPRQTKAEIKEMPGLPPTDELLSPPPPPPPPNSSEVPKTESESPPMCDAEEKQQMKHNQ